jgi:hypothetical protein
MSSSAGNESTPIEPTEKSTAVRNVTTIRMLMEEVLANKDTVDMDLSTMVSALYHHFVSQNMLRDNPIFSWITGGCSRIERLEQALAQNSIVGLNKLEKCIFELLDCPPLVECHQLGAPILPPIPVLGHKKQQWPPHMFMVNDEFLKQQKIDPLLQFSYVTTVSKQVLLRVEDEVAVLSRYKLEIKSAQQQLLSSIVCKRLSTLYRARAREKIVAVFSALDTFVRCDMEDLKTVLFKCYDENLFSKWIQAILEYNTTRLSNNASQVLFVQTDNVSPPLERVYHNLKVLLQYILYNSNTMSLKEKREWCQLQYEGSRLLILLDEFKSNYNKVMKVSIVKSIQHILNLSFICITYNTFKLLLITFNKFIQKWILKVYNNIKLF